MFRTVSQIAVNYRGSRLSEGTRRAASAAATACRGSDGTAGRHDNFAPLSSLRLAGARLRRGGAGIAEACARRGLALHIFPWQPATARAGLKRDAVYLVRPDGYVGLADPEASPARLESIWTAGACSPEHRTPVDRAVVCRCRVPVLMFRQPVFPRHSHDLGNGWSRIIF